MSGKSEDAKRLLALRIKSARARKGYSQAQFAEILGKPVKTWQKVEQGETSVSCEELGTINEAAGNLRIDYYFNESTTYEEALMSASFGEQIKELTETLQSRSTTDPEANTLAMRIAASTRLRTLARELMEMPEEKLVHVQMMIEGYNYRDSVEAGGRDGKRRRA